MPAALHKKNEDNFYRRAQLEAMIREEFADLKVFESDDGEEWFIYHPQGQPDDAVEALDGVQGQIAIAKVMIEARNGEGSWERFRKAGGQSMYVMYAVKREQDRLSGETPGEGAPTT